MPFPSEAINAQGVQLKRGNGGTPQIFNLIGEVTKFDGPGGSASVIDVTTLQSLAKEKRMGLMDEGQFTLEMNLVTGDVQQAGLRTDRRNSTARDFQLVLTDLGSTTLTFTAFVLEFKIAGAVDQVVTASVTLEITGLVGGW